MRFTASFFTHNRIELAKRVPDALIVLTAHSVLQYSADQAYPFRQDSSFWYLTGLDIPDAILVLDTSSGKSTLLLPKQNTYQQEWDGSFDTQAIKQASGIDEIGVKSELNRILKQAQLQGRQIGYLPPLPTVVKPYNFYANPARKKLATHLKRYTSGQQLVDIRKTLAILRMVKRPIELDALRQAIFITGAALAEAKTQLSTLRTEKDLERLISSEFYRHGSDGHGYEPIVASGKNAAIIHYNENRQQLLNNQLVLLDVGAVVDGYSADISRTWAVGTASKRHKEVFAAVQELQQEAYALLKPGVYLREYQRTMEDKAAAAIRKLGKQPGKYPHGFSHFLGLDVHDAGDYEQPLAENCVLTVEPGIYFADEQIGVRIEDNVRITKTGIEVLSVNIPTQL